MHARACNGGDIHHRALGGFQLIQKPARQHDGGVEIDLKHMLPVGFFGFQRVQARAACLFGADGGVVDERMEARALRFQLLLHHADGAHGVFGVGKINFDMILRPRIPRAVFRKGIARAGDDAPAGGGKAFHRGMPNATGGTRED